MLAAAAFHVVAAIALAAAPQQKPLERQPAAVAAVFPCDADGVIRCSLDQVETVTSPRSLEDMRIIGKYIALISERNRRYYVAWQTKAPSAAYEVVKRVKSFPYLPYGDSYSIVGLDIVLNQTKDLITVRYPRNPKQNTTTPIPDKDHAIYSTKLSAFIRDLEKEIVKLKKYEK
jgi:hypothetical protein